MTLLKIFQSQIKAQSLHPHGKRFSLNDKIFALSIYKGNAKAYRIMSRVFALPSRKCITDLLQKLSLETGINNQVIESVVLKIN